MISQQQIPDVLDHMVYDSDGKKIGEARHIFLDERTGQPDWATVRTGLFGSQESFVPIHDADMVEDHLEIRYAKSKVKDAPHIDVEQGRLSEQQERDLYLFYGIDWGDWAEPAGTGDTGMTTGMGTDTATGTDTAAGTGAAAGAGAGMGAAAGAETAREREMRERGGMAGGMTGLGREDEVRGTGYGTTGQDEAMTRSEEHMRVGTERRESGRARLHKYVVTEEVEQTVPLHHEEVRVEREPITDQNVGEAMSGPDIAEAEHEVVLHEEVPVTETEAVPVERVRMVSEEHTEQRTVHGQVRKERIETEGTQEDEERDARRRGRDERS